ncbi:ATP-grasp domain-containing protein [Brachybacterium sp. AOP43-C2-M15]|uniref:ATP-grasp domain-containing protein n=1 Tax=Brachybacterium sp. AOP43-C2-M15 TaxID=3457661 RepID=UPI004033286E
MTRIGIVTTRPSSFTAADPERDSTPLVAALRERGVDADALVWRDPEVDWAGYDLLVIRSPWDYVERPAEFDAWLSEAGGLTRVLNEPELVRWNMDKRYLEQLATEGIAVVPTTYHREEASLVAALERTAADGPAAGGAQPGAIGRAADGPGATEESTASSQHVVLKPAVGAGSQRTGLFAPDDPAALELGRRILSDGGTVLLQPEVPELSDGRERALYAIDGRFTHAIAKGALLARGGGLRGGVYRENPVTITATGRERAFAERVFAAIARVTGLGTPLYGRIDTVDSAEHGLVLLEAELFEPTFNLHLAPEVTDVFADAILARA